MNFGPASPERFMPRGNTHRLVPTSTFQSIERPVITSPLAPWYTRRVQASATGANIMLVAVNIDTNVERSERAVAVMDPFPLLTNGKLLEVYLAEAAEGAATLGLCS